MNINKVVVIDLIVIAINTFSYDGQQFIYEYGMEVTGAELVNKSINEEIYRA